VSDNTRWRESAGNYTDAHCDQFDLATRNRMTEIITPGSRRPVLIVSAISALWLGLCAYYIHAEVGWSSFMRFKPHELGALIAGIFAPLACLWLGVSLVRRQIDLHRVEGIAPAVRSTTQRTKALGRSAGGVMEPLRSTDAEVDHQSRELKNNYATARKVTDFSELLKDEPSSRNDAPNVAKERVASIDPVSMEQTETGKTIETRAEIPSETAETQADQVCRNAFDARRDMFLRASKFVIEDLNSTAIDLNRHLKSDRTGKSCPKFAKGDTRNFVYGVLSEDEKKVRQVIHQKYEHDDKFRKLVSRYIDHFEMLLAEAKECDLDNLLGSTFLSADVGKLYMLLRRTVGRLN